MLNLTRFFDALFNDPDIIDDKLRSFTEDHLQRLAANNDAGAYTAMIAATEAAYNAYFGAISNEDIKLSVQQSLTRAKDAVVAEFKKQVSRHEGAVRSQWGKDAPQYQEFFPHGLTEYGEASMGNIETLMTRMTTAATAHVAELGQSFADTFAALLTNFLAARREQLRKKGEVSSARSETTESRVAVEDQLMDNLLALAREFKRNEAGGMKFFDQSLIRPDVAREEAPAAPHLTATA